MISRFWSRGLLFNGLLFLLSACAALEPAVKQAEPDPVDQKSLPQLSTGEAYWWYVPVKIHWPEEQPMAWYIDVLLAHQIFKPILLEYAQEIELWRFHRRAARDQAGHRFSFIFYARQATATAILDKLAQQTLLAQLMAMQYVDAVYLHDVNQTPKQAIEATSDKNWSLPMQRAWPYFAMGTSQVWLSLIDQHVAALTEHDGVQHDLEAMIGFYQTIDEKMAATWETEGGHALLHHLNALFGYGEVAVYERRMMRF